MPVRRRPSARTSRRSSARTRRIETPPPADFSDEEMQDAPIEAATPAEADMGAEEDEDDEINVGVEAAEEDDAEAVDEEEVDDNETSSPAPRSASARLRARRSPAVRRQGRRGARLTRGAPAPAITPDPDLDESGDEAAGSPEAPAPKRGRGGFRGWRRGFGAGRWKSRPGRENVSQIPLDREGNPATVENDEVKLPDDPEGETKVDRDGHLLDGREYRVRTFSLAGKGRRLYMLSTEPARCIGFRDSYLFFQKHRQLYKIIIGDEAKKDLIERNLIPHSYKGRAIGVVTARSVYREFGAKIVIGGKKITDDYLVAEARANGDVEGEIAVPDDTLPKPGEEYDRNRFVAWFGASNVYHQPLPNMPVPTGESKKRRTQLTDVNWMLEHARAASGFNSRLRQDRQEIMDGAYDINTNQMHYPRITQPTHARWEEIAFSEVSSTPTVPLLDHTTSSSSDVSTDLSDPQRPPITYRQYRNLALVDADMQLPPRANLGVPGPDGDVYDVGPPGLVDVPEYLIAELPPECRAAFVEARSEERRWKMSWGTEAEDGLRADVKVTYAALP